MPNNVLVTAGTATDTGIGRKLKHSQFVSPSCHEVVYCHDVEL